MESQIQIKNYRKNKNLYSLLELIKVKTPFLDMVPNSLSLLGYDFESDFCTVLSTREKGNEPLK